MEAADRDDPGQADIVFEAAQLLRGFNGLAGLPALRRSESGQVRKEAATADVCKCRG